MIELKKVFNFSIEKLNKKHKTIYILCDKTYTTLNNVITEFKNIGIPTSPDVLSILNKIFTKNIKETMFNIDGKYNIIISLFDNHITNAGSSYLIKSMVTNNFRNINLLLLANDISTYYKFTESVLINIYNLNDTVQDPNFFINYLNTKLDKQVIQNIIYLTKCIFICKARKFKSLEELSLEPKIKLRGNKETTHLLYKGNSSSTKIIHIYGCLNTIYALITMFSLLKKKINVKCYLTSSYNKIKTGPINLYVYSNTSTQDNTNLNNMNNQEIIYGENIDKTLITKLLDETILISLPIRFKKNNSKLEDTKCNKNTIIFKLTNNCAVIRLLSIL